MTSFSFIFVQVIKYRKMLPLFIYLFTHLFISLCIYLLTYIHVNNLVTHNKYKQHFVSRDLKDIVNLEDKEIDEYGNSIIRNSLKDTASAKYCAGLN
jgi:hypothetical protein